MGLGLKRTTYGTGRRVYQHKTMETAQSGGRLIITSLRPGTIIPAGTPVRLNENDHTATIVKTAKVQTASGSGATTIQVEKDHNFKTGDAIAKSIGAVAATVSAIDSSNAAYDAFTLSAAIGVLVVGDGLFQAAAAGATAAFSVVPNGLTYSDVMVAENESIAVVIRATVLARRIPFSGPGLWAALPATLIPSWSH